jgi:ribonuclease P protein component
MLPAEARLHEQKEFQKVLKKGQKIFGRMVVIRFLSGMPDCKMGLIVSTKVAKNATDRNRIKRLLREVVRREYLSSMKRVWLVIIAKTDIVDKDYIQIKMELGELFKKRGII